MAERKGRRRAGLLSMLPAALLGVAIFAAAAAALVQNGKISSKAPFYLSGTAVKGGTVLSYPIGEEISCPRSQQRWEQARGEGPVRSSSSVFAVTPTYQRCSAGRGLYRATVAMNGCSYIFHLGETVNIKEYELRASLSCPAGRRPVIQVFLPSEIGKFLACTVRLGSRPEITGAKFLDQPGNRSLVEGTMTGLRDSKGGLCGFGTSPTVRYWISIELKGVNASGEPTEVAVGD